MNSFDAALKMTTTTGNDPFHICTACGCAFSMQVWHCPNCDHHWPMGEHECGNCHRIYQPGAAG